MTRRLPVGAALTAVLLVLTLTSAASPGDAEPTLSADECAPGESHVHHDAARTNRAPDGPQYTSGRRKAIDRRLQRTLARSGYSGARTARFGVTLRIPVHIHVIDGVNQRGPGRRKVKRQLAVLNDAFAGGQSATSGDTRFRFSLQSFERVRNKDWFTVEIGSAEDKQMRRALHRGGADALNLYIARPESGEPGVVALGWSSVPWRASKAPKLDGVTIHHGTMPGTRLGPEFRRYREGDTAVHEVGHWLGLFHTFEGGCATDPEKGGDLVADTPPEAEPSLACQVGRDTCEHDDEADPIHNFMDYSYDACMYEFTPGQARRMTDNWLAFRTP